MFGTAQSTYTLEYVGRWRADTKGKGSMDQEKHIYLDRKRGGGSASSLSIEPTITWQYKDMLYVHTVQQCMEWCRAGGHGQLFTMPRAHKRAAHGSTLLRRRSTLSILFSENLWGPVPNEKATVQCEILDLGSHNSLVQHDMCPKYFLKITPPYCIQYTQIKTWSILIVFKFITRMCGWSHRFYF